MYGITVVIPTIAPRADMLKRAVQSVWTQTEPPDDVIVVEDVDHEGAAVVRDRGLDKVSTEWVAFLDDDDEMGPDHLKKLHDCALSTEADLVFPWYTVIGGTDPFAAYEHLDWLGPDVLHQTTITFLVRTAVARAVGGFNDGQTHPDHPGIKQGEDYRFVERVWDQGHKIVKLKERTWFWHHHGLNTSGRSDHW